MFSAKLDNGGELILPVGVKQAKIRCDPTSTILGVGICNTATFNVANSINFPIVNGKSPCKFRNLASNATTFQIVVEEIGGIPDPNYFEDTPTVIPEIIPDTPTGEEMSTDAV